MTTLAFLQKELNRAALVQGVKINVVARWDDNGDSCVDSSRSLAHCHTAIESAQEWFRYKRETGTVCFSRAIRDAGILSQNFIYNLCLHEISHLFVVDHGINFLNHLQRFTDKPLISLPNKNPFDYLLDNWRECQIMDLVDASKEWDKR